MLYRYPRAHGLMLLARVQSVDPPVCTCSSLLSSALTQFVDSLKNDRCLSGLLVFMNFLVAPLAWYHLEQRNWLERLHQKRQKKGSKLHGSSQQEMNWSYNGIHQNLSGV